MTLLPAIEAAKDRSKARLRLMERGSLLVGPFAAKDADVVVACTIPGDPLSKQRPRWNRKTHTMYTPTETRHREVGIAAIARLSHRELVTDDTALFSLRAGFYLKGNQARDVDNMLKLIADALTGVVWKDDRQMVEVFGFKTQAETAGEARTEFVVCRMPGGMLVPTMMACVLCKRTFRSYPSWRFRKFCSLKCSNFGQQRRESVTCSHCGKRYDVPRHIRWLQQTHRFCSRACKTAFGQETRRCVQCGAAFLIAKSYRKRTCSRACASAQRWQVDGRPRIPHEECRRGHSLKDAYVHARTGAQSCRVCAKNNAKIRREKAKASQ